MDKLWAFDDGKVIVELTEAEYRVVLNAVCIANQTFDDQRRIPAPYMGGDQTQTLSSGDMPQDYRGAS